MTLPLLNPAGLHVQVFDATAQASGRGALATVADEALAIGLARRVAQALSTATKIASIDAKRMVFIGGDRPSPSIQARHVS